MRQILFFAVAVLLAGGYFARYADQAVAVHPTAQTAAVEPPPSRGSRPPPAAA